MADEVARNQLVHHDRRLTAAEDDISETRRTLSSLRLAIVKLEAPVKQMRWLMGTVAVATVGILVALILAKLGLRAP